MDSDSNSDSNSNVLSGLSPGLSKDNIDGLWKSLRGTTTAVSVSSETLLTGREVLVPAFGGGVAFFEGKLRPQRIAIANEGAESNETYDEVVCVSRSSESAKTTAIPTTTTTTTTTTKRTANGLQQQQQQMDCIPVRLSAAIEWLQKHSSTPPTVPSNAKQKAKPTTTKKTTTTTSTTTTKMAKPITAANAKPTAEPKPKSNLPKTKQPPKSTTTTTARTTAAAAPPMFNIQEEYAADGTKIAGRAVNLSTRLKAVYGDDRPENFNTNNNYGEESKTDGNDYDSFSPSDSPTTPLDDNDDDFSSGSGATSTTATATSTTVEQHQHQDHKHLPDDEEYDRISRRLEELALMEEEAMRLGKSGLRPQAKKLGAGGRPSAADRNTTTAKSTAKETSSFGFQKGFLNNSKSKNKTKKKKQPKALTSTSTSVSEDVGTGLEGGEKPDEKKGSGAGVKFDVSQNRVHEIPREGKQQPLPTRAVPPSSSQSRPLGADIFSGEITERGPPNLLSEGASDSAQSLRNELRVPEQQQQQQQQLQQQQQSSRPKRVSRFKQQRQQEQRHLR